MGVRLRLIACAGRGGGLLIADRGVGAGARRWRLVPRGGDFLEKGFPWRGAGRFIADVEHV